MRQQLDLFVVESSEEMDTKSGSRTAWVHMCLLADRKLARESTLELWLWLESVY